MKIASSTRLYSWSASKISDNAQGPALELTVQGVHEMLEEGVPGHGEPEAELRARGMLLDGSTADEIKPGSI